MGLFFVSFAYSGEVFIKKLKRVEGLACGVEKHPLPAPSFTLYLHPVVLSWGEFLAELQGSGGKILKKSESFSSLVLVLWIESWVLCAPGKCSTTVSHRPSPQKPLRRNRVFGERGG